MRARAFVIAGALVAALATACATQGVHLWNAPAAVRVQGPSFSGWGPNPEDWEPLRVAARAVDLVSEDAALRTVGPLVYRGGLDLASDDPRFGGLSGLHVEADGRLIAVSDRGDFFVARLTLDDDGDLVGLVDPRLAAMRDAEGRPFPKKDEADSEDIARLPDGRFAVSFEQTHNIRIYDLAGKGPNTAPDREIALAGTEALKPNESLESLAPFGDRLLTAGEGFTSRGAPFWITPLASDALPAPAGRISTRDFYGLVALAALPDGDYLAMERFFAPVLGVRIHMRRVERAGLEAGRWEGADLADFAPPAALDNFEGLAVVPNADGSVRLYMIADDNFSPNQRTLLYAFDLPAPQK
jgi:hypothetical protein